MAINPMEKKFAVNVVLVRTIYDSNIGASSRAMANMGIARLILIDPKCEITYAAQQAAASGQGPLQNRVVYGSWDDFFATEPDGIRIAMTAKDGAYRQVQDLATCLRWMAAEHPLFKEDTLDDVVPVYMIFGPEDWGLSTTDIELTHFNCSLPTFGENSSMNLAQAVLVALFILRTEWGGKRTILEGQQPKRRIQNRQDVFPEKALQTWIEEMGYGTDNRKINAFSVLRRMLLNNVPTQKELRILDSVLHQGIRKLREYNELRKKLGLPAIDRSQQGEEEN